MQIEIKLETHFLRENIIWSGNLIKKIRFRSENAQSMFIFNKFQLILTYNKSYFCPSLLLVLATISLSTAPLNFVYSQWHITYLKLTRDDTITIPSSLQLVLFLLLLPPLDVAPMQWMKNSEKLTPIYMVCITGLYKETHVQMLRICANYFVGMIKSSDYGH
jgi:hypothetical protein